MTEEMVYEFDKQGTNWNNEITPKDVFSRTFDIAYFLQNHSHPIFDHIKPIVFGRYKVVMKFKQEGSAGSIWINNRWLACRQKKFSPVRFNKAVKLIEGTPMPNGGSINYPAPTFKEGYCVLEFSCNGLPMMHQHSEWKTELISLEKIN